jgi:hypothetical protein
MRLVKILAPLAITVLLLAAPGCDGGESELTTAQFIQRGDAICTQAAAEQVRLVSHYKKGEVAAGNLEAVTAARIRGILMAIESGLEDVKADYLDLFVKETDPFAEANELAQRYGLNACARSSHAVIRPQD